MTWMGVLLFLGVVVAGKRYMSDWKSLDSRPLPDWYDDAKIGVFMHAAPYSLIGKGAWFWYEWKVRKDEEKVDFMEKYYPPNFAYQDLGAMYKMEYFNASFYADFIADFGARYFVYTSKHHDGFVNTRTRYSFGWNSMDVGPKRDVLGEIRAALATRQPQVHFGLYYSLFEFMNPLYIRDKENNFTTRDFVLNKMIPEMKELAIALKPEVWWSDGDWESMDDYWSSKEFLAWLYNDSPVKDVVCVNDRWGKGTYGAHGGFYNHKDHFHPDTLLQHKWENAFPIANGYWSYFGGGTLEKYYRPDELITELIATISCGGNVLVDVGPAPDGSIQPLFQERAQQVGGWLKVNGEAIYASRPWVHQNDSLTGTVWYTRDKMNTTVYALVTGWPETRSVILADVAKYVDEETKGEVLVQNGGLPVGMKILESPKRLEIQFPSWEEYKKNCKSIGCDWAFVIKLKDLKEMVRIESDVEITIMD